MGASRFPKNQWPMILQKGKKMQMHLTLAISFSYPSAYSLNKNADVQVVVAYGAESDRSLGVPGEDLAGIYSVREFVWWYNGQPDCRKMAPDPKSTDTAVVLGQVYNWSFTRKIMYPT
ncbi:hypothetical protein Cni_G26212 [Canna indica]|uniref:Uncharacterized protein n=1 Tax=Canna indica TaxID=4628 RepID=A0AAQ3KZA7_9LILI|nr:hypothetical protein Cni_G26212 [Canna indica]